MSVTVVIKSATLSVEDFGVECELTWSIGYLKGVLEESYPGNPKKEHQKLIYGGKSLPDDLPLKSILNSFDERHIIHLICPTPPKIDTNEPRQEISDSMRDELRNCLENLKQQLDDIDRANKAAVVQSVSEEAKNMFQGDSKNKPYVVHEFKAGLNAMALDAALKQVKVFSPGTAAMFFTRNIETNKILCMSSVPQIAISKGLKADEWVQQVSEVIGGKGGGTPESAQASGTNATGIREAMNLAKNFAEMKLSQ